MQPSVTSSRCDCEYEWLSCRIMWLVVVSALASHSQYLFSKGHIACSDSYITLSELLLNTFVIICFCVNVVVSYWFVLVPYRCLWHSVIQVVWAYTRNAVVFCGTTSIFSWISTRSLASQSKQIFAYSFSVRYKREFRVVLFVNVQGHIIYAHCCVVLFLFWAKLKYFFLSIPWCSFSCRRIIMSSFRDRLILWLICLVVIWLTR